MSILSELQQRFAVALRGLVEDPTELLDLVRRSQDPKFGDYQANFAMPLGKRLRRPPRQVAAEVIERLQIDDLCTPPEIAGPGFINLRLRDDSLAARLTAAVGDPRLGVPRAAATKTYVIDYSAPNVAKPMHVGHIRSTVIGDSLSRVLRFAGHRVISDNHLGDWGTQFGMIIYGYRHFLDREAYQRAPVEELARVYRQVRCLMDESQETRVKSQESRGESQEGSALDSQPSTLDSSVLAETVKLHSGDAENLRVWREVLPLCLDEIDHIYRRLGVTFDHTLGESFYHERLGPLVEELMRKGIARESEGAICIFLDGFDVPMIIRKKDGAFLYATTDLATLRYRMETWNPDAILYVVDHRQSMHFGQLFAAARRMGYDRVELQHVSFGTVLGEDNRPFKTRSGDTVGLEGLLDEAVRRAGEVVDGNDESKPGGRELSPAERARVAETVGIAALKYADLSQNRTSDYVFSYDKMLAMNGNTATYMQYAYARVRSIFAKGNVDPDALRASGSTIVLATPAERALGLDLLRFGEALEMTLTDYRPNQLTSYLYDLANRYSTFFDCCPVLRAETDLLHRSRLLLCDLTARTIRQGLDLLGINVVDKM